MKKHKQNCYFPTRNRDQQVQQESAVFVEIWALPYWILGILVVVLWIWQFFMTGGVNGTIKMAGIIIFGFSVFWATIWYIAIRPTWNVVLLHIPSGVFDLPYTYGTTVFRQSFSFVYTEVGSTIPHCQTFPTRMCNKSSQLMVYKGVHHLHLRYMCHMCSLFIS